MIVMAMSQFIKAMRFITLLTCQNCLHSCLANVIHCRQKERAAWTTEDHASGLEMQHPKGQG